MTSLRRAVGVLAALTTVAAAAALPTAIAGAAPTPAGRGQDGLAAMLGASRPDGVNVVRDRATGLVRFVGTPAGHPLARPAGVGPRTAPSAAAHAFLSAHADMFGVADPASQLAATTTGRLPGGGHVARFQERVDGHPVLGGELAVALTRDNQVLSVDGATIPSGAPAQDVRVTAAQAVRVAVGVTARSEHVGVHRLAGSTSGLAIYDPSLLGVPTAAPTSLVYRVDVVSRGRGATPVRELVLVDATKGVATLYFDQIERAAQLTLCDAGNRMSVIDPTCPPLTNDGSQPTLVTTAPATGSDGYDAERYAQATYDFYAGVVGDVSKLGIAGSNGNRALNSTVRYCDEYYVDENGNEICPMDNAFWDGHEMVYGAGFSSADDVVAHELTHGVTEHTSDLFYLYQSGAINESMSDVMGEIADQLDVVAGTNDADSYRWMLGEDLPSSVGVTRDMADPTTAPVGVPTPYFTPQPDSMVSPLYFTGYDQYGFEDNGGVHVNSGVGNKAAYLVIDGGTFRGVTVPGLGGADPATRTDALTKAAKIYYAADEMLTSGSDYADLFQVLPQACRNLVGTAVGTGTISDTDCQTVTAAVTATAMDKQASGGPRDVAVCDNSLPMSSDWFDNLENTASGYWAKSSSKGPWYYPASRNLYGNAPQVYATSGTKSLWGDDVDPLFFQMVGISAPTNGTVTLTKAIHVPSGKPAYLRYNQAYLFDWFTDAGTNYYADGGRVEYSTDGGKHWVGAGSLMPSGSLKHIVGWNYDLDGNAVSPRYSFYGIGGDSHGYGSTRLNLSSLAGKWVRFRFRVTADGAYGSLGWFIDDVRFYTCGARPAAPASVGVTPGVTRLPVTWTAPTDHGTSPLTGYQLTVKSGSTVLRSVSVPASTHAWTFTRLPNGRSLTVYVAAVNGSGTGPATRSRTLTGSALSIHTSSTSVPSGQRVTIGGRLVRAGTTTGLGGKAVGLYRAKVGSTSWSYVTRTTTGPKGYYTFRPTVSSTYQYRTRFAGSTYYQGTLSAARTVKAS